MAKSNYPLHRLPQHSKVVVTIAMVASLAIIAIYFTWQLTNARIEHNEHAWLEAQINALIPTTLRDNDLLADHIIVVAPELLGTETPVTIYRARRSGLPVAAVINCIAPDGYGGPIELLVAISYGGEVLGVHVLAHHETPGIGNAFELPGSHWLDSFKGHSLHNPESGGWNVHKDGGEFEQFTSATITPRAIIKAVQRTLDYYQHHRDQVFAAS
jgi:electron transport complex protein RnfG